jgi:hypothetical protein
MIDADRDCLTVNNGSDARLKTERRFQFSDLTRFNPECLIIVVKRAAIMGYTPK